MIRDARTDDVFDEDQPAVIRGDAVKNCVPWPLDCDAERYLYRDSESDDATSLRINRARWFDPTVGRFLNVDPVGYGLTNDFRYTSNAPPNPTDPTVG